MLEASLRGFLSDRLPMERRRAIASEGNGLDPELWAALSRRALPGSPCPSGMAERVLGFSMRP